MNPQTKTCQNCKNDFTIESEDFAFYEKIKVPPPTFCPECRFKRRLIWRNERTLYRRKCDLCHLDKIFMYPADAPFPVYCKECWWSDGWDAKEFRRDYDFSKPFFTQMYELMSAVPRPGTIQQGTNIASEYANRVFNARESYLVFDSTAPEFCMYSSRVNYSKECVDCFNVFHSEQCYDCIDCTKCSRLFFSRESQECIDSYFLYNCRNCTDCFGCVNLRNGRYCFFNEQLDKDTYKAKVAEFLASGQSGVVSMKQKLIARAKNFPEQYYTGRQIVDSTGNWLEQCNNVKSSFICVDGWNLKYCAFMVNGVRDCMDYTSWGIDAELVYETINAGISLQRIIGGHELWSGDFDITYGMNCHSSNNLFGCIGIKNGQYMILNKQYTKDEYVSLVEEIKLQMQQLPYISDAGHTYGFGEFYPPEYSPFCYNESISQTFFPISESAALAQKLPWRKDEPRTYVITLPCESIPNTIGEVTDAILNEVIGCANNGDSQKRCTLAFKITKEELAFYKRFQIPLPTYCHNCRYDARISVRHGFALGKAVCMCTSQKHFHGESPCDVDFETACSANIERPIYCEKCYQAEVV